jgi:hypothetical protein
MGWELVYFLFALWFAAKFGASALWGAFLERRRANAERKAHKSQLVTEAIESGVAPKAAKEAADKAARVAVTVSTRVVVLIAARDAWVKGWQEGWKRGIEKRDGIKPANSAPDADQPQISTGEELPENRANSGGEKEDGEKEADSTTRPEHENGSNRCQPHENSTDRESNMTIESKTGGEVHSLAQLLTELDAIKAEASAELEDAQANSARKGERVQHIDTLVASLRHLRVDEATVGAVQALQEPFQRSKDLADSQAASAEHELMLATAARETAQRNHGQIREAVVASAAPAADGAFYNE